MRSAISGNDCPDWGDSRPRVGNPWQSTSPGGASAGSDGSARWPLRRHGPERNR